MGLGDDPFDGSDFGSDTSGFADRPRRGRGLLVGVIALAVIVLVGGGVTAFLLTGRSQGTGVARPEEAVNQFLTAVYKEKDASAAEKVVCASSRDSGAMRKRIKELRTYEKKYKSPSYSWPAPTVESRKKEQATIAVPLKIATSDDKVAEQRLTFLTVKGKGWLVCEVTAG